MDNLPMNVVDMGVIALFLVGALVGLAFGFVRGGLFILSWLGATVATFAGFMPLRGIARNFIEADWLADIATGGVIFLVTLIILMLLSSLIGGWIRGSRLNALDRSLGMLAGLFVAAVIMSGGYIIVESVWPKDQQPPWLTEAKSVPYIKNGADLLGTIIPKDLDIFGTKLPDSAARKVKEAAEIKRAFKRLTGETKDNPSEPLRPGYGTKERQDLERLIQTTR